jgi:mannose-1-phosphate guanylyltransferase
MKAMVMAAGLGTRLRPITFEVPKPMVPVGNRPIFEQILRSLAAGGVGEVVSNLHWFPETIRGAIGDGSQLGIELTYSYEDELLGTAGGVLNVREFFGDEPFLVMAGDALTDVDFKELARAHAANDGIATLVVKRVANTSEYGVIVTDSGDRVQGFQEKPDPAEALSDRANCMIYAVDPEIFDHFPDKAAPDFALDIFPALLDADIPFHVYETERYWNDVGSLPEYLAGNLDAVEGEVAIDLAGELLGEGDGERLAAGVELSGRVLIGDGAEVGEGARIDGPCVIGAGATIGAGARVKESVLLPGAEVPQHGLLANSIAGRVGALGSESE